MIPITVKDLYFLLVIVAIKLANQIDSPLLRERIVEAIASAANRFSKNKRQQMESNLDRAFADQFDPEQLELCRFITR
jgi:lauroyl/myristoyl acyltransferase